MAKQPLTIVVLVSGFGSNLQAIIDAINNQQLDAEVKAVISNRPDSYGLARAQQAGIPSHVINHDHYHSREAFDQALQGAIDQYQPQLVVLAGFMRILSNQFVQHYQGRMINIHPSLLPKYRGLHTHQRVIEAGDSVHGLTIHFVTKELDGGPNILQVKLPVLANEDADSLQGRIQQQEHGFYPQIIQWFADGRLELTDKGVDLDGEPLSPSGYQMTID